MGVGLHSKSQNTPTKRAYLLFPHENLIFSITNIIFDFDERFGKTFIFQGFYQFLYAQKLHKIVPKIPLNL